MRLVQWDPFQMLAQSPLGKRANSDSDSEPVWVPAVDIFERDADLVIRAEVSGIDRDAIEVKVEENTLILSGERKRDDVSENGQAYRRERVFGRFERSFRLPKTVDPSAIAATYRNGVLEVLLPKAETAKPRTIEIKVA